MNGSNADRRVRSRISGDEARGPLLDYLAARFTYQDRGQWQEHVEAGRLRVNERCAVTSTVIQPGDLVEFLVPERPEPPVDSSYRIVFEDDLLLVVEKPADLPCHPSGRYRRNTLWWLLNRRSDAEAGVTLIHRIDRETSGLVLAAKARWAAGSLGRQFQKRRVLKRYRAIVEGAFPRTEVEAHGFLAPDRGSAVRKRRRFTAGRPAGEAGSQAEACHTRFRGLSVHGRISLVEAVPLTGRLHQIRATLFGLGYPVVGDKIYGRDEGCFLRFIRGDLTARDQSRLRLPRQALHAAELRISHPATGAPLRFFSALPGDMQGLIDSCGSPGPWT